jgi:hypothetical protein
MKLTADLTLLARFRMHRTLPLFPPCIFMAWCLIQHLTIFTDSLIHWPTYRSRLQSYIEKRPKITGMSNLELCCFKSQEFPFSKSTDSRTWSDIVYRLGPVPLCRRKMKQHQLLFTHPIYWPHNCVVLSRFPKRILFKHSNHQIVNGARWYWAPYWMFHSIILLNLWAQNHGAYGTRMGER